MAGPTLLNALSLALVCVLAMHPTEALRYRSERHGSALETAHDKRDCPASTVTGIDYSKSANGRSLTQITWADNKGVVVDLKDCDTKVDWKDYDKISKYTVWAKVKDGSGDVISCQAFALNYYPASDQTDFTTAFLTVSGGSASWAGLSYNAGQADDDDSVLDLVGPIDPTAQAVQQFAFACDAWPNDDNNYGTGCLIKLFQGKACLAVSNQDDPGQGTPLRSADCDKDDKYQIFDLAKVTLG